MKEASRSALLPTGSPAQRRTWSTPSKSKHNPKLGWASKIGIQDSSKVMVPGGHLQPDPTLQPSPYPLQLWLPHTLFHSKEGPCPGSHTGLLGTGGLKVRLLVRDLKLKELKSLICGHRAGQ